jgi:hypothetical protein
MLQGNLHLKAAISKQKLQACRRQVESLPAIEKILIAQHLRVNKRINNMMSVYKHKCYS